KHHEGGLYRVETAGDALEKGPNPESFDKEVGQLKRCAQVLADPRASLRAKDPADRLFAATLLLQKYRPAPTGKDRLEPINPQDAKLILAALRDAEDWGKYDPVTRSTAQTAFQQLTLPPQDGWTPPPAAGPHEQYLKTYTAAARAWLREHAEKYRI